MGRPRTTFQKLQKERARQEKKAKKAARRVERQAEREDQDAPQAGEDPDIVGMVPGPQPTDDEDAGA